MSINVTKIDKKHRLNKFDIVKYQIITEFIFLKKEHLTAFDIDVLTLIALWNGIELSKFCKKATKFLHTIEKVEDFANKSQNIRNRVTKLQKRGLVTKINSNISIVDGITIYTDKSLLLNYSMLSIETTKA